jgi:hypothetical protein
MNPYVEKLIKARDLILEAEEDLIKAKKFCPYEVGFTLRKLDEAINQLKDIK